jgi:hypothetical protein
MYVANLAFGTLWMGDLDRINPNMNLFQIINHF